MGCPAEGRGRSKRLGLSPAGKADLQWRLEHLLAYFASMRLDEITVSDVDAFRLSKVRENILGATSINKMLATLAAILESAVEYELIARNPAKGPKRRLPAIKPRRSWLDCAEHIAALLDGAGELDRQGRASVGVRRPVIATLTFAGLRLGELQALYWHDIDLRRGTIRVREAKTDAGVRIVNMLPILHRELSAYRDRLQPSANRRVFAPSTGSALGASNIRTRILERAVERADAALEAKGRQPMPEGLTPHSLRRTFASLLFALGESPPYVMSQMGHTTPALTLAIYAREMSRRDGERQRLWALVADEIRLLCDHREGHVQEITRLTNQLRWHLVILDPALEASIPARKMDYPGQLEKVARRLRSMDPSARVRIAKEHVRRIRELSREATQLKRELHALIAAHRPDLLAETGGSTITAAILIGQTAGAERFPTDSHFARMAGVAPIPVSSGRTDRHRLHRGGNRRINRALHVIAITRGRWDPATRAYLQRKEAEGENRMEALRCLKRLLARHFHALLLQPPAAAPSTPPTVPSNAAISVSCLT